MREAAELSVAGAPQKTWEVARACSCACVFACDSERVFPNGF